MAEPPMKGTVTLDLSLASDGWHLKTRDVRFSGGDPSMDETRRTVVFLLNASKALRETVEARYPAIAAECATTGDIALDEWRSLGET